MHWREREGLGPERPAADMPRDALADEVVALRRIVDYQGRVFCEAHQPYGDETPNGHGCPCCTALAATSREHALREAVEEYVESFRHGDVVFYSSLKANLLGENAAAGRRVIAAARAAALEEAATELCDGDIESGRGFLRDTSANNARGWLRARAAKERAR
jgi:hypothetical protein